MINTGPQQKVSVTLARCFVTPGATLTINDIWTCSLYLSTGKILGSVGRFEKKKAIRNINFLFLITINFLLYARWN